MKKEFKWEKHNLKIRVKIDLKETPKGVTFSCVGDIYKNTYFTSVGQCQDAINEILAGDELWDEIYIFWQKYHLNDMNAGTKRQKELLSKHKYSSFEESKEILKDNNLLYDDNYLYKGLPYQYGSSWLFEEIPEEDITKIKNLLSYKMLLVVVNDKEEGILTKFIFKGNRKVIENYLPVAKKYADENYTDYSWEYIFYEKLNELNSEYLNSLEESDNAYIVEDNEEGVLTQFISYGTKEIVEKSISKAKTYADKKYIDDNWKDIFYKDLNRLLASNAILPVKEMDVIFFQN